jgi:hypothetical protein
LGDCWLQVESSLPTSGKGGEGWNEVRRKECPCGGGGEE